MKSRSTMQWCKVFISLLNASKGGTHQKVKYDKWGLTFLSNIRFLRCKSFNYYLKGVKTCILKVETIRAFSQLIHLLRINYDTSQEDFNIDRYWPYCFSGEKSHWELVGGYVQMVSKRDTLNNDLRSCPFVVIYMIKL